MKAKFDPLICVIAAMALAAVVGCSGEPPEGSAVPLDDAATTTSSATPTPSPTKSATASPTFRPTGDVERQLYDATTEFYAAVSKAYQTLDPAPIKTLVWPKTTAGGGYIKRIADMKAKGHKFEDAPTFALSNFNVGLQDADPNSQTITVTVTGSGSKTIDRQGKLVNQSDAGSSTAKIQFMKMGDRWLVLSQRFED